MGPFSVVVSLQIRWLEILLVGASLDRFSVDYLANGSPLQGLTERGREPCFFDPKVLSAAEGRLSVAVNSRLLVLC